MTTWSDEVFAALKTASRAPTEEDLDHFARRCYVQPERDFHYTAVNVLRRRVKTLTPASVPLVRTDTDRLVAYCLSRSDEPDFFYRKAIGWALRQYARTDPDAVLAFCEANMDVLSPLSSKEATKHLAS